MRGDLRVQQRLRGDDERERAQERRHTRAVVPAPEAGRAQRRPHAAHQARRRRRARRRGLRLRLRACAPGCPHLPEKQLMPR